MKQKLQELKQLQKIAGLLKEDRYDNEYYDDDEDGEEQDQSDYYINVAVRDAKNALEILRDEFANEYKNRDIELDGTDSYVIKDKDIALDLMDAFKLAGIEVIKTDVPEEDLEESESNQMIDQNPMDDLPSVDMDIDDDGNMTIRLSAFFHSKDNGKIALLGDNQALQDVLLKAIQLETQKAFRSAVHGVLGKPYGLK